MKFAVIGHPVAHSLSPKMHAANFAAIGFDGTYGKFDVAPEDVEKFQTLLTRGSGKVTVTGQLGDVMKESVQIAVSLVKSMLPEQAGGLKDQDLHIHVPDGATPKDGPSAGVTMATALVSALTGRKVRQDVAMTGEITLRGRVLPIGGVKEKLLAAYRAGIKTILLPKENLKDLEDVKPELIGVVKADKVPLVLIKGSDEDGEFLYADTVTNGYAIEFEFYISDAEGEKQLPFTDAQIEQVKTILATFKPAA